MNDAAAPWDYLIVTASNDRQAQAYESQLAVGRKLGLLARFREVLAVADPEGRRVGSGGSTIFCLLQVVNRELALAPVGRFDWPDVESILRRLRILIVHAGGDSRRLPAYGPCGKIFIPVPGENDTGLGVTLFDRLIPGFINLPPGLPGAGQVVMAAGDALILLDASKVSFAYAGLTALTCPAGPEHASKHGVFCPGKGGEVRLYLQKPRVEQQQQYGAINAQGQALLDIGIMSFDASMVLALFKAFGVELEAGKLVWNPAFKGDVLSRGVDFYREICCALGAEATAEHYMHQTRQSGTSWPEEELRKMYQVLAKIPFRLQTVSQCRFLHFGTTRQLIASGAELRQYDQDASAGCSAVLQMNNQFCPGGKITGDSSWVEGCRLSASLTLGGQNVVVGVNVAEPLTLPEGACLDVLQGQSRQAEPVWFIRYYGIADTFKDSVAKGATFCGRPLMDWLKEVGVKPDRVWDGAVPVEQRSLWNARVFPAARQNEDFLHWLWMLAPEEATRQQKTAFQFAERYSAAEIANLAGQDAFFARRRPN